LTDGWWESAVQIGSLAVSIAVALMPLYVAYLLSERSKRREFERDKAYDRKQRAYESALGAARKLRRSRESLWVLTAKDDLQSDLSKLVGVDTAKDLIKTLVFLMVAYSLVSTGEVRKAEDVFRSLRDKTDAGEASKAIQDLPISIFLSWLHESLRAGRELEEAISALRLANAPATLLTKLEDLGDELRAIPPAGLTEEDIDSRLEEIEAAMSADLLATIRSKRRWR
jgi:hypothetical protein